MPFLFQGGVLCQNQRSTDDDSTTQLSTSASFWHACKASVNGLSSRSCTHPGLVWGKSPLLGFLGWLVGWSWLELVGKSWLARVGLLGAGWNRQQSILKGFQKKMSGGKYLSPQVFSHSEWPEASVFPLWFWPLVPKQIFKTPPIGSTYGIFAYICLIFMVKCR